MGARISSPAIIGRDAELSKLRAAWRVTCAGEPQLILISGEAGVGKTRLAREFALIVERDGGRVLSGVCIDLREGGLPYAPIRQALRAVVRNADDRQLVAGCGAGITALIPDLGDAASVTASGPQARRVELFESLLQLFQGLAANGPVLLVVDDVQWADQATLDLLTFLARNLVGVPVLELLTFRDDRLAPDDPLQGFLIGQGSGTVRDRLELSRLDVRAVAAQIAAIRQTVPDPELVERVFERSDGNPFFVEELLAAGTDSRSVPVPIRELLLSRVVALPAATRHVLRLAAVAGRTVSHRILSEVADIPERELAEALRAAIEAQVLAVDDADGYAYRHTLLREAIYNDLLPAERSRLHLRYAALLATDRDREPSLMGAVATHHDRGGEPENALPAFIEAANAAERSFAFADAARYLRRAVELWGDVTDPETATGSDKVSLLSRAIDAALAVEDPDRAITFAREALTLVDADREPARTGRVQRLLGTALWMAGREQESFDAYLAATRVVPEAPSRERAEVLTYHAAALAPTGRYTEARAVAFEAIDVARRAGATAEKCRALLNAGSVTGRLGDRKHGLKLITEAETIARRHNLAVEIMRVHLHRGRVLQSYAAWEEARETYGQAAAEAPKFGMARRYLWRFRVLAARMLFWLGRWDDAAGVLREAREQHWGARAMLPALLVATGQWDAATSWFEQPHSRWRSDGVGVLQQPETRVELATWLGDYEEAMEQCIQGLELVEGSEEPLPAARLCVAGLRVHANHAETADGLVKASASATHLRDRLKALAAERPPRTDGWGRELHALAATGDAEFSRLTGSNSSLWRTAAAAWTSLSMPYPATYAHFRHGQALLTTPKERADAAKLLHAAHSTARELGATPLADLIERSATLGGVWLGSLAPDDLTQRYGLTRREQQVLALLLEGRTNRQIGTALYIEESTASVHVSRILRKLGVSSRGEAISQVLRATKQ